MPARCSFAAPGWRNSRVSAAKVMPSADNFLQKQQKQRKLRVEKDRHGNCSSGSAGRATDGPAGPAQRSWLRPDHISSAPIVNTLVVFQVAQLEVRYAAIRNGGTSRGMSRLQPVAALTSSTVTPGAISRRARPSFVTSKSP